MKVIQALKAMKYPYAVFTHSDINTNIKALKVHYENLPEDQYLKKRLNLTKPMRQRRMMQYEIEFDKAGNLIQYHENYDLHSYDEKKNLQYAKIYEQFTTEMKNDQNFKDFMYNTLNLTWQVKPFNKASVSVHAVRTLSYAGQPASPTPEGPHQDGTDFEVIAVVNKKNCQGAESQIYSPDKSNLLFEMTLDPGEGYIIDDKHLWNYATDHRPIDPAQEAIRDIIGFVLKVKDE